MRFKYRKLLMNLANSLDALVSAGDDTAESTRAAGRGRRLLRRRRHRRRDEEDRARGGPDVDHADRRAAARGRLDVAVVRAAPVHEIDWLNGEIVLLGRQYGVPTPVNAMLQQARQGGGRGRHRAPLGPGRPTCSPASAESARLAAVRAATATAEISNRYGGTSRVSIVVRTGRWSPKHSR